jgi:hypothetical protein
MAVAKLTAFSNVEKSNLLAVEQHVPDRVRLHHCYHDISLLFIKPARETPLN